MVKTATVIDIDVQPEDLESSCKTKEAEWATMCSIRAEETLALAETIKILNDDDALELFKKALPAPSLLQLTANGQAVKSRAIAALKAATGEDVSAEELGGAEVHTVKSGVADHFAETEVDALCKMREIVLDAGDASAAAAKPALEPEMPFYDPAELGGIIPEIDSKPIEVRQIIARIVDGSRFREFKAVPALPPTRLAQLTLLVLAMGSSWFLTPRQQLVPAARWGPASMIVTGVDEGFGRRIDDLDNSISELIQEAGAYDKFVRGRAWSVALALVF